MKRFHLAIALTALSLAAQEPPPPEPVDALMERALNDTQLRAAGRRAQGAEEAPADVTVLSGQELRALGYRTVGAALAGVLGFRSNDDQAYANVGLRGLYVLGDQNTRILVLLDGHPLNSPAEVGSSKVGEDFAIPLERIDHIEIIRGPASSLYGSNAFLGVVNVVTLEGRVDQRGVQAGIAMGGGGLGDFWGSLQFLPGSLRVGLNFGGFRREGEVRRYPGLSPDPIPREAGRESREHAYLVVQGPTWNFSSYLMNRVQRLPTAPFLAQVGSPANLYRNRIAFGEFRFEPKWGEVHGLARVYWDWNLFWDSFQYDGMREAGLDGLWTDRDLDQGLGGEVQLRWPLGDHWSFISGLDQAWHRFDYTLTGPDYRSPREIKYRVRKIYAEAEWAPSASLGITLGAQRSELFLDQGRALINPDRVFTLGRYGRTSPRLALVWRPQAGDTLKALYSEGFRNPTIFERFPEDDGLSYLDNPALRLESLRSMGLLWRRDWGSGWHGQAGLTALRWTDAIRAVDLDEQHQQYQNVAEPLKATIAEAELGWRRAAWDVRWHWAWNRWRQGSLELDNAARSQAGLRVIWHRGAWSLAGEWRGVGARSLQDYGQIPFQSTLRMSVRWERGTLHLQATGEDLLDRRPEEWVAPEYYPVRRISGDGRQARLDLGWRF
jgi:iron complex outermembrane receptor protein